MNTIDKLAVIGNSGHALDIRSTFLKINPKASVVCIEKQKEESLIQKYSQEGYKFIIGVGDNQVRYKLVKKYKYLKWCSVISPSCSIGDSTNIGLGTFLNSGVFISHHVSIGNHSIVNANSSIGHDTVIEDFCQICTNVSIGGKGVQVKLGSFLGSNTVVKNKRNLIIGEWSQVSLGSVISKNISKKKLFMQILKDIQLPIITRTK